MAIEGHFLFGDGDIHSEHQDTGAINDNLAEIISDAISDEPAGGVWDEEAESYRRVAEMRESLPRYFEALDIHQGLSSHDERIRFVIKEAESRGIGDKESLWAWLKLTHRDAQIHGHRRNSIDSIVSYLKELRHATRDTRPSHLRGT